MQVLVSCLCISMLFSFVLMADSIIHEEVVLHVASPITLTLLVSDLSIIRVNVILNLGKIR